jgi:hypothetical protein
MPFQILVAGKTAITCLTLKRFLSFMNGSNMIFQTLAIGKFAVT